jgi:hypothetical protein
MFPIGDIGDQSRSIDKIWQPQQAAGISITQFGRKSARATVATSQTREQNI